MNAITKITDSATKDKTTPMTIPETQRKNIMNKHNSILI